jgi:hypothetical protein
MFGHHPNPEGVVQKGSLYLENRGGNVGWIWNFILPGREKDPGG